MSVINDPHPSPPHLHKCSSPMNTSDTVKIATPPSTPPRSGPLDLRSAPATPTPGVKRTADPISPISPLPPALYKSPPTSHQPFLSPLAPGFSSPLIPGPSTAELMTSPNIAETVPSTLSYVPSGTPGTSNRGLEPVHLCSRIPLQTTFPTEVFPNVLPDLASSAGDAIGRDDGSFSLGVVSAILSEDSRDGSLSSEIREAESGAGSFEEGSTNGLISRLEYQETAPLSGSSPIISDLKLLGADEVYVKMRSLKLVAAAQEPNELRDEELAIVDLTPLHATRSMPVWMPSSVSNSPRGDAEPSVREDLETSRHATEAIKVESLHSTQSASTEDPALGEAVSRTKSMPASNSEGDKSIRGFSRSSTEKRRTNKNMDNENVRVVAEAKMSDRKKKKLMKKLATVKRDGAVEFDIGRSARVARDLFGSDTIDEHPYNHTQGGDEEVGWGDEEGCLGTIPPLKIVMLIVGTRGDVQPFIAIGKRLQEYGHRVRLASHANFRDFVKREGLEFYPLGGDPKVLAGYMVKNKGFLPSSPSEIPVQRQQIKSIVHSLLPACTEPDQDSGVAFEAQAIIANPPAYGHVHVAEYLKIPLHIFFTMPWTPTSAFPHPLSRVKQPAAYRMSYQVVDTLIWLGIRGMINSFRKKKLKLRPINYLSGGSQGSIAEMPTGYIWSPHLVPKPKDWGPSVDVVGFCFLNLATDYKPPDDLVNWLQAGPLPIYIGFGSLPVEDPEGMTKIIVEALNKTGQRGIIGKGWGGIGNLSETPPNVFLLSDCPHDWLFPQCAAVVHHGGAGTTAAGLKAACPTTIIPFFGDQPFWGDRVREKGVGPAPIPVNHFTLERLVSAIEFMLQPAVKQAALELSKNMEAEDGIEGSVNAFHKHIRKYLPQLVCSKTVTLHHDGFVKWSFSRFRAIFHLTRG